VIISVAYLLGHCLLVFRSSWPVGAENLCHLGKCLAERGWAFGAWPTRGAPPGGGMIFGLWA